MNFFKSLYDWFFCCLDFFKRRSGVFIVFFAFCLTGIIAGIWYGATIEDVYFYITINPNMIIEVTLGEISFIKFYFVSILSLAFTFLIAAVFSLNFYVSIIGFFVALYEGFIFGITLSVIIIAAGLSSLAFILICFIPFGLAFLVLYVWLFAAAFDNGYNNRGCGFPVKIGDYFGCNWMLLVFMALLKLVETILTFIFAKGFVII